MDFVWRKLIRNQLAGGRVDHDADRHVLALCGAENPFDVAEFEAVSTRRHRLISPVTRWIGGRNRHPSSFALWKGPTPTIASARPHVKKTQIRTLGAL
jgi:hypothetical protein